MKDTFVKSLQDKDIIYPTYHLCGSKTMRMKSTNPNIFGFPENSYLAPQLKRCFKAPSGYIWHIADYDSFEARMLANLSMCQHLIEIFTKGLDYHLYNAALLWRDKLSQYDDGEDHEMFVRKLMANRSQLDVQEVRRKAKRANYAITYGAHPNRIAIETGLTYKEAQELYDKWHYDIYREVTEYRNRCVAGEVHQLGLGATISGRDEKVIYNACLQFWSILTLLAIHNIHYYIDEKKLDAKICTCKHDAVYSLVHLGVQEEYDKIVKNCMESIGDKKWPVPLVVNRYIGENWEDVKKL